MKTYKAHWLWTLLVAGSVLLAGRAQAAYTNYLDSAVMTLTFYSNQLAMLPTPTPVEKREFATVKRVLKTLNKPSASVAGDYNLFFLAVVQLGPLAADPALDAVGTNAFNAFVGEAQAEFFAASVRVTSLSDFIPTKKAASNQLFQASSLFMTLSVTTNKQTSLFLGRQIYSKIVQANKLAAMGEAHPGFAPNSLVGETLTHTEFGKSGTVTFTDGTNATEVDHDGSSSSITYTYTRTGLNTATLVLDEGGGNTTTVHAIFTSASSGHFNFVHLPSGGAGSHDHGLGTFTLTL